MSLQACAELLKQADPDRFLATMAAPPAARTVLFPVFAFNIEIARAPWVTAEPMIAEMRLQWWRDALAEIGSGGAVRGHEVLEALAPVLDAQGAALLDGLIEARRVDTRTEPFADEAALSAYLDATSGNLLWAASRALGAPRTDEAAVRAHAWAAGLANWFLAIPELEARGRRPLPDGRPETLRRLAQDGLARLNEARVPGAARAALLTTWRAGPILQQARRDPALVAAGALGHSEFRKRISLLRRSLGA